MSKIYVPVENINNNYCYEVLDSQTIRVFPNSLVVGDNSYTDYYINSHYLYKEGIINLLDVSTVNCVSKENITNDYYYRNDLAHIIIICSFVLLLLYFCYRVFARMFGRWLKL